jgi:K+-transporting ATPase ATPase C chain
MSQLRPALTIFLGLTALTGIVYPLAVTGAARLAFPGRAGGSLIRRNGQVLGSSLIAQDTEDPKYFWGRLSATSGYPTNPMGSGGSNLSVDNPALAAAAEARIKALRALDPSNPDPVPEDLVTASGSGLDPHISPLAASFQASRVARARGLTRAEVMEAVARHTESRELRVLGEPRVNVLELNLDLDARR